ncbi:MAG: hypothetical protein HY939_03460 [Gammaproteobacteria bacterium]|nr:hypothetical protein [Gammaproteobacteria bacterium]
MNTTLVMFLLSLWMIPWASSWALAPSADATTYYEGMQIDVFPPSVVNNISLISAVSNETSVRQTYLVPTGTFIPVPNCPSKLVPQIYTSPALFADMNSDGQWPVQGVYTYANPIQSWGRTAATGWAISMTGWIVSMWISTPNGWASWSAPANTSSSSLGQSALIQVITQCCNPNDPASLGCSS